ncbi:MAG TPA: hypothetical protein VNY52_02800 [Solirubrobacteraceae bacterium]|nr:hypothetical protein [Solirubrobacteraceae bacterium]
MTALLLALALGGCESSQEKSAQIERQVRLARAAGHGVRSEHGLRISGASTDVRVVASEVLHDSEGTAAVVTLRNRSTRALRNVPIAISVRDAAGGVLYQNNSPGLEAALTTVALLPAGAEFTWIDDQVQASGAGGVPRTVRALVGGASPAPASTPRIRVTGVHATAEGGGFGVGGTVTDDSSVAQRGLVVYGIARRGGRIVAAGRAVLSEVPAHGSSPFQVLFIGSAQGAQVEASAPPSTF